MSKGHLPPHVQRLREEMEEITQQQLVHDKYCKDLMGFGTKPRHITPFTSFQAGQPPQSNALVGLLGYSSHQGLMGFGASPSPAKSTLVESRCCRDLMEEKFDQVGGERPAPSSPKPRAPFLWPTLCSPVSGVPVGAEMQE